MSIKEFDPISTHFVENPWSELKRMRESCRGYRHQGTLEPCVSFFHDQDLREMRRDWETWSSSRSAAANKKGLGIAAVMIGQDPPEHTALRKLVAPHFLPGKVHALQPAIDASVKRILDEAIDNGEVDYHEQLSAKLAISIIGSICGIPEDQWEFLRKETVINSIPYGKGSFYKEPQPEIEQTIAESQARMGPWLMEHLQRLMKDKSPSILTSIAAQMDDPQAIAGLCILIVGAGNDTSSNLMTNGLWELVQKPDQMQWLRENPEMIDQAVEEMARCRGSLRRSERIAAKDVEFGGVEVNRGDTVILWNASASRDPSVIPDRPDEFDVRRKPTKHMAFGAGIHMCIGNILARLETRTLLRELLVRTSNIEEARGADSYQHYNNGILDMAKSYHLRLNS